jgi:dihydropteroate synthase
MIGRVIEIDSLSAAEKELLSIGSDKVGVSIMTPKAVSRVVKIKGLKPPAANIVKQEMLSFGGEAANAYGSINHSVETTDLLIFGTLKQLHQLLDKLRIHPFGLPEVGDQIAQMLANYENSPAPLRFKNKTLDIGCRTFIMGILNVTPDSFSDGGKFVDVDAAVEHAKKMLAAGADIIDVGGESTRPGSEQIPIEEEKKRVLPVIEKLSRETDAIISIDTTKAEVARAAVRAGAALVNDVSGLRFDARMAAAIAELSVPLCLMHIKGKPRDMQDDPTYSDLMGEIINYLEESLAIAKKAGILHEKIIIDPGIGFGKTTEDNLEILKRLKELKVLGRPIMVGTSRKSVIGKTLDLPVNDRLEGTAATVAVSIAHGADLIRVHDVKEMARVAKMTDSIVRRK